MAQSMNDEEAQGDTNIKESKTVVGGLIDGTTANDDCEMAGHESHVTSNTNVNEIQYGSFIFEDEVNESGSIVIGEEVDDDSVSQRGNNVSRTDTNVEEETNDPVDCES